MFKIAVGYDFNWQDMRDNMNCLLHSILYCNFWYQAGHQKWSTYFVKTGLFLQKSESEVNQVFLNMEWSFWTCQKSICMEKRVVQISEHLIMYKSNSNFILFILLVNIACRNYLPSEKTSFQCVNVAFRRLSAAHDILQYKSLGNSNIYCSLCDIPQ